MTQKEYERGPLAEFKKCKTFDDKVMFLVNNNKVVSLGIIDDNPVFIVENVKYHKPDRLWYTVFLYKQDGWNLLKDSLQGIIYLFRKKHPNLNISGYINKFADRSVFEIPHAHIKQEGEKVIGD